MNRQPRALYLLNFVSMWENFSYYGMRALLVLFMIQVFRFSDTEAFGLYAIYTTLVELGGVVGGIAADRYLGLKRSIILGSWTIALGHLCMAWPDSMLAFFLGLGLITAGTGLFRSNAAALLGEFYQENDPRRDAGYTLYYTGINIGGFLASLVCGIVGEVWGWHAGFSLAALGMLSGNIALLLGWRQLAGKGEKTNPAKSVNIAGILGLSLAAPLCAAAIYYYQVISPLIPFLAMGGIGYIFCQTKHFSMERKMQLRRLGIYVVLMMIFYGCEEQLGSSLILFAERHVDRDTGFGVIPAASLITFNPLTILITGPLLSRLMQKILMDGYIKIALSFILLSAAFGILYAGSQWASADEAVPFAFAISSIVLIALGEIFIGPTVYAYASEIAPAKFEGLIMSIVTIGFSLANLFSGWLSQLMAVSSQSDSLQIYANGFGLISAATIGLAGLIIIFNSRKKVVLA